MAKNIIPEIQSINQIGSGTIIKGEIKSNGDFRIDGTLNGSIESKGKIVVGESGQVDGEITCQNAVISGKVKATIRVNELLELKSSASFTGEIVTNKLAIEPGAKFSGSCNMSQEDAPSSLNRDGKSKEKPA
ncbi:MAG: polymer-forming cytoskeletal protein [Bacteroidetes bacterium]|nr:polymer-forming cytoskeletal protein [Bacteroidota bacterium]